MGRASIGRDPGSARAWFHLAIRQSHPIKHERAAIVPLQANPIPTDFSRPQLAARPFMIEPGLAADRMRHLVDDELARRFQSRDGTIMRSAGAVRCLYADSVFAVNNWRFRRAQL